MLVKGESGNLEVKIDYKLSRFFDPKLDRPGPMLKKLLNCHPDMVNQRPLDFRSDIWSLGKIFVELLSADLEISDFLAKIDELDLPEEAKVLLKVMLADDPDIRPRSMAEVAVTLARLSEGTPEIDFAPKPQKAHSSIFRSIRKVLSENRLRKKQARIAQDHVVRISESTPDSHDIFSRIRHLIDSQVGHHVPDTVQKFTSVYQNLQSKNPEDWSNAVHSCRRILQNLADAVFPPQQDDRFIEIEGKLKRIKLGPNNYINRIMCFIEDNSDSKTYNDIVGSQISFMGDRLDAIFKAAQKGSHSVITSREEADRYVVYTYMLVSDILSLKFTKSKELSNSSLKTETY
jgi:serine/threonine protein kinase